MRVLLFGANGQLGRALRQRLPPESTTALTRHDLDLRSGLDGLATRIAAAAPDVVVNAAADNRVDAAETDTEGARALNVQAVGALAEAARDANAFFVHFGTDYVFDGRARRPYTEDDAPNPESAYGRAKLAGERLARSRTARHAVIRLAGLYGHGGSEAKGGNFVERVLARARQGESLRIVDDQVTSPTYAADAAAAVVRLLPRLVAGDASPGIYHVTNAGACSWYEFACAALGLAGVWARVEPIASRSLAASAPRPAYSVLANTRLAALGEPPLRPWRDALAAYLAGA